MARRDTAARRYAEAAFEIGRADGTLELWERDLLTLRDALRWSMPGAIEHPALAYAEKERVVRRIVGDVLAGGDQPGAAHGAARPAEGDRPR